MAEAVMILLLVKHDDLALVFVDFSKAFDSVDRSKMFEILRLYGIPEGIIAAIKVMYTDHSSTVMTTDGETQAFPTLAGILQVDTLALFLFIIQWSSIISCVSP